MSQTPCAMGDDNPWPEVRAHGVIGVVEVAHRVMLSSQSNGVVVSTRMK